ncbi:hypothetical protein [Oxalicibacterium faecigallinarum]|uniref:hypothetical protein n=1 Tax=Oxalicibacterium faecigallinarum TaxID=573741 RepID=UPI00280BE45A|nr:hypothetical protein [Oxalicibacterium faecigallinarum]
MEKSCLYPARTKNQWHVYGGFRRKSGKGALLSEASAFVLFKLLKMFFPALYPTQRMLNGGPPNFIACNLKGYNYAYF